MGKGLPLLDPPDPIGPVREKANEKNIITEGGMMMSKIIAKLQKVLGKVTGHKYTVFTLKTPFINFSFAPAYIERLS